MHRERLFPGDAAKWLVAQVGKRGVGPEAVLKGTGLARGWLDEKDAVINPSQYRRLVLNALGESRDPALGLTASGQTNYLSHFGFWGYSILSSANWSQAGDLALRYWEVTGSLVRLVFHDQGDTCVWEIFPAMEMKHTEILRFAVEKLVTALFATIRFTTGAPPPVREVGLHYPAPAYADLYEKYWKTKVLFDQEKNWFRLDASILKTPIILANPGIRDACVAECRKLLYRLGRMDELVESIRNNILGSPGDFPDSEGMARQLGMTARTLRRRLKERGTTYQRLLDEIRSELAMGYLTSTSLSMEEISGLLGYGDASSFRRSFRKWTGRSASEVRKGLRARSGL